MFLAGQSMHQSIPFHRSPVVGRELENIAKAIEAGSLDGGGRFSRQCEEWLIKRLGVKQALLTHSCTAALEMAALLADIIPGDEVIMPSFTFVSTANAVVLRAGVPVFVDIRPDTLNINEKLVEAAITPRTKAIFAVHYAGVCAEMDMLRQIADKHRLLLVEDAAQALLSTYHGRPAGALSDAACFSFHASKNVVSGEGGAFVTPRADLAERAEIIREKGTNRTRFLLGLTDKYTWIEPGSSFLPSELVSAFLRAQLDESEAITADRLATWNAYHTAFVDLESRGITRPTVPVHCGHNGHLYYLLLRDRPQRDRLIRALAERGIGAPFHYVPLHSSPAGRRYARTAGPLPMTDDLSGRLIRMPLWMGMRAEREQAIACVLDLLRGDAI
jgi:dTDP-4-amino-4,6-dideoxygalactose transaminase